MYSKDKGDDALSARAFLHSHLSLKNDEQTASLSAINLDQRSVLLIWAQAPVLKIVISALREEP